jgi:transcriptional regulator with XRE-family HTH domain
MENSRVRKLRERAALSQDDLASKAGISQATLSRWERAAGLEQVRAFARLAKVLGVPMERLLGTGRAA